MLYKVFGYSKKKSLKLKKRGRKKKKKRVKKGKGETMKKKQTNKMYMFGTYRESKRFVYHHQSSYGQSDWLSTKMH